MALGVVTRYASALGRRPSSPKRTSGRGRVKRAKTERDANTPVAPPCPIVVGFNQVMNALEAGRLAVLLACREDLVHPQVLHHLPFQCRLVKTTLVPLPLGASREFEQVLNLPRVSVLGFAQEGDLGEEYRQFLKFVQSRVPSATPDLAEYQSLCLHRIPVPIPQQRGGCTQAKGGSEGEKVSRTKAR